LHTLRSGEIETVAWLEGHVGAHHCAGREPDACCEDGRSGDGPGPIFLRSLPLLACRADSIKPALPRTTADTAVPAFAAVCVALLRDSTQAPDYRRARHRCIDELLATSHALLM
jgi:hypothetical protein